MSMVSLGFEFSLSHACLIPDKLLVIMLRFAKLFSACLAAQLIPLISAAPAAHGKRASTGSGQVLPIAISNGQSPGPPGDSGSVYGSPNLVGPDRNTVHTADSAVVSNYDLVSGQQKDANLGLYLDLSEGHNPQPMRGTGGGTDPGPRTSKLLFRG